MTRYALLAGLALALAAGPAAGQAPPELSDFSVLAVDSVTLKGGARVVAGAVGAATGAVSLRRGARVAGTTIADSIRLAPGSRIGRVFCNLVSGRRPLPTCVAPPLPIVDPAAVQPIPVVPGTEDLIVRPRQGIAPVAPGSFDEVVVGRGSLLTLAGGAYAARSIRIARGGELVCAAACRIGVAETIVLGPRASIGARAGLNPSSVRIDVAGGDDPPALRAKPESAVIGTIFAPGGLVRLGRGGSYRGAFVGNVVVVGAGGQVRAGSAL